MIYPTRLVLLAAGAGLPVTLVTAVIVPGLWYAGLAWPAAVILATLADAMSGARVGEGHATISLPKVAGVGADVDAVVQVRIRRAPPLYCEVALNGDPLVALSNDGRASMPLDGGEATYRIALQTVRRGTAVIDRIWLRWRGPLGLTWKHRQIPADARIAILPDLRPVRERGARIFERQALQGLIAQIDRGDGIDFDSLVEFRAGMDRRAIDWKQSARHSRLRAKEFRSERNNQLIFAIDSGRQMSEPVGGLPRVDRAVSAMLLVAWVALKLGDRVALHAFDCRPRIASGIISGVRAFAELQDLAARIDYSSEETNYTFALTSLATKLHRRSMIVLFTEFTDLTSADFMLRATARLLEKHLLLVVVLREQELEDIADRAPETADDVTRAITAAALLRDRRVALTRLRHLGAHVIESRHDDVPEQLVNGYIALKRRSLL